MPTPKNYLSDEEVTPTPKNFLNIYYPKNHSSRKQGEEQFHGEYHNINCNGECKKCFLFGVNKSCFENADLFFLKLQKLNIWKTK